MKIAGQVNAIVAGEPILGRAFSRFFLFYKPDAHDSMWGDLAFIDG
jgi:hypothetical protein